MTQGYPSLSGKVVNEPYGCLCRFLTMIRSSLIGWILLRVFTVKFHILAHLKDSRMLMQGHKQCKDYFNAMLSEKWFLFPLEGKSVEMTNVVIILQ